MILVAVQTGSLLLDAVSPSQVNIQVPPALTGETYFVPQWCKTAGV